ncbi:tetratricopeptide repeat protein [Thioflexithrix psekupsensis]|uniref:Uncharacterized protein n=1 Tax=Thioflexithrix psekupsensis TaxID=1570016 RepID=A0A251XAZ3_9GAMM|nr:tetratricopeptide repeat protein [Thioflexithrix psekupsensis]OUD15468.1 hypothetical protein TPSD3_02780 [Thioflexithrix psekupsensis]
MKNRFIYHLILVILTNFITGCAGLTNPQGHAHAITDNEEATEPMLIAKANNYFISSEQEYFYKILVAEIAAHREQYELSATHFLEVAEKTNHAELAERAARIALYAKLPVLALSAAHLWVKLVPDNPEARQVLGSLLLQENRTEEALVHLEAMLENLTEDNQQQLDLISLLSAQQGNEEIALKLMKQLVDKRGDDIDILLAYSRLLYRAEQFAEAKLVLNRLLALDPMNESAVFLYANLLNQQENSKVALGFLEEKMRNHADPSDNWRFLYGRLLTGEGEFEAAFEQFSIVLENNPDTPDIIYASALIAIELERFDVAREYLMDLLENTQQQELAYYYLGQIAEKENKPELAIDWYKKVSDKSFFLSAQIQIVQLLIEQNQFEAALNHLQQIQTEDREEMRSLLQFEANLLIERDLKEAALAVFERGLLQYPDDLDLYYARAMTAESIDRLDILEQDLRHILSIDPDHVEAINALGYTLADRTDRYREAYELIEKALSMRPDSHYIIDSMGWVLYRLGQNDQAIDYLRRALAIEYDAEIAAHLGEVLWATGAEQEAREILEKALEQFPNDKKLLRVMERFLTP